jgi:predicted NBD/HSP70 family sugar kinase
LTGHIPGTTVLRRDPGESAELSKGFNQVGLRAANERLVLSLIRAHGQLSKAQIAELSGLTTQTASVISRSLMDARLLKAGPRVGGKVGQPYVPLSLNAEGAMFFGLHLGEHELRLALVDFTGSVITEKSMPVVSLDLEKILKFTRDTVSRARSGFDRDQNTRVQGLGISVAGGRIRSGGRELSWQELDGAFGSLGQSLGLTTYVASEAVAACSAELIYGIGGSMSDFAYVFIAHSVSGGLIQNGRIRFARDDTGSNMGRVLVPSADGRMVPLRTLAKAVHRKRANTESFDLLVGGIAHAAHSAASVVSFQAIIIDGSIEPEMLKHVTVGVRAALDALNDDAASALLVREGSRSRKGAVLGASCLPLVDRFYPERSGKA